MHTNKSQSLLYQGFNPIQMCFFCYISRFKLMNNRKYNFPHILAESNPENPFVNDSFSISKGSKYNALAPWNAKAFAHLHVFVWYCFPQKNWTPWVQLDLGPRVTQSAGIANPQTRLWIGRDINQRHLLEPTAEGEQRTWFRGNAGIDERVRVRVTKGKSGRRSGGGGGGSGPGVSTARDPGGWPPRSGSASTKSWEVRHTIGDPIRTWNAKKHKLQL